MDRPSWSSSVNTTEIEICIQNSKMGVLSDDKGPNSNDYTACAIGLELPDICDNDNCQLPKDAYCPGNQWFQNPVPSPIQARIFDGEAAVRSSWPWIVSLSDPWSSSQKFCGGQIVTDEWILTAGHCCEGEGINDIRVNIGDHLYQEGDEKSYLEIQKFLIHPDYRSGQYSSYPYDFCMVQTKEKMIIDGVKTQVACFPDAEAHADSNQAQCWTAGWGKVSSWYGSVPLQLGCYKLRRHYESYKFLRNFLNIMLVLVTSYVQLQTVKLNLYDDETCYNHAANFFDNWKKSSNPTDGNNVDGIPDKYYHYGYDYFYDYFQPTPLPPYTPDHTLFNSEVEFCAGHYNMTTNTYTSEADSCHGDSGGPLGTEIHFHDCGFS